VDLGAGSGAVKARGYNPDVETRDEKLLEGRMAESLLAGEAESFERFVEHFRAKVFRYSWLMCGSPEDAEEVAQETLLKAFQNLPQLRDPASVRAWVFRIAKNVCLMRRRRSVFAPAAEVALEDLAAGEELADMEQPPETGLLQAELRAVIDRVILELPPPYRAVVVLRDIEELSTEDTAQILDLSTDVVKTRLHRGRSAMRQKLDCYVRNHCLEDQPSPNPAPLTAAEREELYGAFQSQGRALRG
jgi:RNA polymerase sigma-70 factor, ECF subfamily